jgi:hypothetical protein
MKSDHEIAAGLQAGINVVHNPWCFQESKINRRRQLGVGSARFQ